VATHLTKEQIQGMNLAQLQTELKSHWERYQELDQKYPGIPIPAGGDYEESKYLLGTVDLLEAATAPLQDAAERSQRIAENVKKYTQPAQRHTHPDAQGDGRGPRDVKSLGEQFLEAAEYKALRDSGLLNSPGFVPQLVVKMGGDMLKKALLYSGSAVGGAFIQEEVLSGIRSPILQRELTVLDLVPRTGTTSNAIEYVRQDTWTNAAATVAESTAFDATALGGANRKPESSFAFSNQTANVKTIAHWVPVTNQQLADAPALRGIIDAQLILGLNLTLESQIISGDGTGSNLTGILNATGINVYGAGSSNNVADAILQGMNQVRVTGLAQPTATVMHPTDWTALRLMRENASTATFGGYLLGPPSVAGPMTLWGRPVVESMGIAENTALTGDFMWTMLFDREEAIVRTGYINDQFIKNMVTLLAELRAAFVTFRGAAFSKITGV
jgi:HK97 family phage major capsid protein